MTPPRTLDEQTQSLASYLPTGRAWGAKNIQGTITRGLLAGLAGELIRNEQLLEDFKNEILPDETTEFLDEWESALGIPDDCFTGTGSVVERRNDVLAKLASLGIQTAEDFRLLALQIYGLVITITSPDPGETFPWTFPHTFGLSDREARFTIRVNYDEDTELKTFPYTFPIEFQERGNSILNCLFRKLKPANVDLFTTSSIVAPFDGGGVSLDFTDDVTNKIEQPVATLLNMANSWTWMVWVKHDGGSSLGPILKTDGASSDQQQIRLITTGTVCQMFAVDAAGNTKDYRWPAPAINTWIQIAAVHDVVGDTLRVYANGVEDTSPTKTTDDTLTMTDITRIVEIGDTVAINAFDGRIYAAAIWNAELTAAEVTAIYNSGDGRRFNLRTNSDAYQSASLLQHWWRPGREASPNFGRDSGVLPVDLTTITALTDADRVTDAPQ